MPSSSASGLTSFLLILVHLAAGGTPSFFASFSGTKQHDPSGTRGEMHREITGQKETDMTMIIGIIRDMMMTTKTTRGMTMPTKIISGMMMITKITRGKTKTRRTARMPRITKLEMLLWQASVLPVLPLV